MSSQPKRRVAILISGRGSNMKALVEAAAKPGYPAEISMVISNRPEAEGIAWAKAQSIPTLAMDHNHYESREHFEGQLNAALISAKIELVAMAGFMRVLTDGFVTDWKDRLINIHPSLLPSFKGLNTHARALEAGVKIAGCTVHFVRPELDNGPIIMQAAVPVLENDSATTLAARVLTAEHKVYPQALALVAAGLTEIKGQQVQINSKINQQVTLISPDPV
jgi:phosphoribosylglycinamide formyltransferase 1